MPGEFQNWLQQQGLAHLESVLTQAGVDLDVLGDLSEVDLTGLGLSLGDRKRLLKAVAAIPPSSSAAVFPAPSGQAVSPAASPPLSAAAQTLIAHPEAQRRQVTVMFCDLVGSTSLSTQMDPEDLRELIGRYHQHASREIRRAGGYVAKFMGDGVLAYFGYPQASENDAERSVRAGLAVVQGMQALNLPGRGDLQVRVGIATGTVVDGDLVVEGTAPERAVVGETPNLAARLQSLADPGKVLIGSSTRRLLGELFELQDLGAQTVKGFADPVPAWLVLGERAAASRFEAQRSGALSRFVGRDSEVAMLMERWDLATEGEGQVVLLTGEAGIGKSRITAALRQRVAQMPGVNTAPLVLMWQCSPLHTGTPLHPVIHQLQQSLQSPPGLESTLTRAGVPEATRVWVLRLAGVGTDRPSGLDPSVEKTNTLYAVVETVQALAAQQPVLLLIEDAHWIDPTTEELLAHGVQQLRPHPVMLAVTARPGYEPAWQQAPNLTRLTLSRLAQRQSLQLAQEVAQEVARGIVGKWSLPADLLEQIVKRTDGVPLFVEELTRAVLEAGLPQELQQGWQGASEGKLVNLAIPSTLQDSLTARLDRLQPTTREVAQAASVIGREFSQGLLREVLKPMSEQQVTSALQELQRVELAYLRQGEQATGSFKHALVRDAAYGSLLKAQRAQWHAKVARALQTVEPRVAAQQPELLAGHRQQAGELAAALELWREAGDLALGRSSLVEAAEHYRAAIALCPLVQPEPTLEFHLQMQLAGLLTQTQGYGSDESLSAARRALELSRQPALQEQRLEAARAVGTILVSRGQLTEAEQLFENFEEVVAQLPNPGRAAPALWILGVAADLAGRAVEGLHLLSRSRALLEADGAVLPGTLWGGAYPQVSNLLWLAGSLMSTGHLDQGFVCVQEAVQVARATEHPPTVTWALQSYVNWLLLLERQQEGREMAQEAAELSERHQIKPRIAFFRMIQGRALVASGQVKEGALMMRSGFELWLKSSATLAATVLVTSVARAMASVGDLQSVMDYLDIGERLMRDGQERLGHAEILRLRGWARREAGDTAGAKTALSEALAVARQQGARFYELFAAMDLVKLQERTEHEASAVAELRRTYESFTEGFQFPVLISARRLLAAHGIFTASG
jgi:class 3 adenylate cyclase/tetratricopeptide (TPR) repeat protein